MPMRSSTHSVVSFVDMFLVDEEFDLFAPDAVYEPDNTGRPKLAQDEAWDEMENV